MPSERTVEPLPDVGGFSHDLILGHVASRMFCMKAPVFRVFRVFRVQPSRAQPCGTLHGMTLIQRYTPCFTLIWRPHHGGGGGGEA